MSENQSLGEQEREIRQAWEASQKPRQSPVEAAYSYVMEAYDDFIIVEVDNTAWKVTYQRTGDEITFAPANEWQEVEQKREWIAKTGNALKAISETDTELRVGNYIVLFGNESQRDAEGVFSPRKNADGTVGEYFTKATDLESMYTATGHLLIDWEHGEGREKDKGVGPDKDEVFGWVDWKTAQVDDVGVWVERVLNRRSLYMQAVDIMIKAGKLGTSSKAVDSKVVRAQNGEIIKWPLARDTFTVSPMEYRMMNQNVLQAAKALGLYTEPEPPQPEAQPEAADNTAAVEAAKVDLAKFELELFLMED